MRSLTTTLQTHVVIALRNTQPDLAQDGKKRKQVRIVTGTGM